MKINIGNNIKRLRIMKGITQEGLAEVVNVSCAAVSKWERGETLPDITLLQPLAYYFGLSIDELVGYDREKDNEEIEKLLSEYWAYYSKGYLKENFDAAREIIVKAYQEYPNDYRIMNCYMWNLAGDAADDDPEVLLGHMDEFTEICDRIIAGCTDEACRLSAWNMKAKLLHAKGDTAGAIEIYEKKFVNWYMTTDQKKEQLFAKDTPDFLKQVKINMNELSSFAADKLCKSVYFDYSLPLDKRINKAEYYGDKLTALAFETEEPCFISFSASFWGRLENDIKYRGGGEEALKRAAEAHGKLEELKARIMKSDPSLSDDAM